MVKAGLQASGRSGVKAFFYPGKRMAATGGMVVPAQIFVYSGCTPKNLLYEKACVLPFTQRMLPGCLQQTQKKMAGTAVNIAATLTCIPAGPFPGPGGTNVGSRDDVYASEYKVRPNGDSGITINGETYIGTGNEFYSKEYNSRYGTKAQFDGDSMFLYYRQYGGGSGAYNQTEITFKGK